MKNETLEGKLVFKLLNKGSKSEYEGPVLEYVKEDKLQSIVIRYLGDNPFEHSKLVPYDGKYVQVKGNHHTSLFIINSIKEINKP